MVDKQHAIEQIIEQIRCAKINVENIRTLGVVMIEVVQLQLDEAIKALEDEFNGN